uniref:Uncharacterized protein n=1 Tax=Cryptomonas curvata TaxID=233186 RepID=A0A7S0LZA1_9CRYP
MSRARGVVREALERRRVAAASCLERAWRRRKAQQCVRALAAARATAGAGGDAVLCRLRLGLRGAQRVAMEARATTGTRFRVALLGGAAGGKPAEKAWICAPARLLEKVRAAWPAAAIRGRFQVDLPATEVEAAAAAGELVLVDAYGAAADVCSGDDGEAQLTREMGLVPISDLIRVSVSVLLDAETPAAPAACNPAVDSAPNSTTTGGAASAVQLFFWFRRESTLRAVTERCRVALHHTADIPVRICYFSFAAESLPLDSALTDQAEDGASGMVNLWLDLRDRQEVVVAAQSVGVNRRDSVIVLPLESSISAMCAAVTAKLDLPEGASHFPPLLSATLLGEIFSAAASHNNTSTPGNDSLAAVQPEEEMIMIRGGSLRVATVACRDGAGRKFYALRGPCPISPAGGLVVIVGGEPPHASKQRTAVQARLANSVTAQSGMEWHLWPLVQGDTAAEVLAWLAVLGAMDSSPGSCEGFDLVLPNGVAAGKDSNMTAPGVARAWLTPSHTLVQLEIQPGSSCKGGRPSVLRTTVGCPCSTLAERAATVCGLARGRLFCGGVAVPEGWAAADLPSGGTCWSRSSVNLSVEPPGGHASFRLQVSFGSESVPGSSGFPSEVEVTRCGVTLCSALVDSVAAAHGGCALVCTLAVAASDGGDPIEVDLGDDGDITCSNDCGTTLEELAAEDSGEGSRPTLLVGLRPCARRLTTAIAADGGLASATRAVFVVQQMGVAAVCRAAMAVHGVPVTPGLDGSAVLWFRAEGSSDEEEVDTDLTVGDILESLQVELDKGVFVIRYSTNSPSKTRVAATLSAAQSESANAPSTVGCSASILLAGSKSATATVEVAAAAGLAAEEKAGNDSQLEAAKDADVVTHTQPTRTRGPTDYVTVEWKEAEEDRGVGTD